MPVKGTSAAKSRLGASPDVAMAIALDTVEAASGAARVVVVAPPHARAGFVALGASVVDDEGDGLDAAISAGLRAVPVGPVAVLLGDLPALTTAELDAALAAGSRHPRAFVSDADGVGTVLITALAGVAHHPAFGGESRAAHLSAGYVELEVGAGSGLRRDVDTPAQLEALATEGRLGPRTTVATSGRRRPATPA